ncbi:MAG TPA: hypothetical protein VHN15_06880 [Thermoanaerobaculia bacterium]|nr:hypothetical protein [Thermoanaerobaculia bacterium]
MKIKKKVSKLSLTRETVAVVSPQELRGLLGALPGPRHTISDSVMETCVCSTDPV